MKSGKMAEAAQTAYLLEYGKRKMKVCADTFLDLAQIMGENIELQRTVREDVRRSEMAFTVRLEENRRMFAGNFREIAAMMNEAAEESLCFIGLGKKKCRRIIRGLAGEGIAAGELYLMQMSNGRIELSAVLSSRNGNSRTVEEAAEYLSVLSDMRLVSSERNPFFIGKEPVRCFFREEPEYLFMTGTARAVKETETVSGDNFAFFEAGDGNLTAVLSDGTGSGEEACRDSEMIADMTEGLLETGITPGMAVGLVNSAMLNEGMGNRIPTLDLCSIDLYEGKCQFLKSGAAASFIKRGSAVETITSGSFPLGTFGNIQPESTGRELSDGDLIIMVSDGVTESWNSEGEEKVRRYLSEMDAISPTELANRLLRYTIGEAGGRIRDDMTILVMGFWERGFDF